MTRGRRIVVVASVAVVVGGVGMVTLPPWRSAVAAGVAVALLVYAFVEALTLAAELKWPGDSPFDRAMAVVIPHPDRPPDLEHLEAVLGWRSYSARDFDVWALPALASLVRSRLLAHHGVDVAHDREAARALLPPELAELAEPVGRARPSTARGAIDTAGVGRLLDLIEDL